MLRLTGFELYKIWGKKMFWGVLMALLLLNLFLLWYTTQIRAEHKPVQYRTLSAELKGKSEADKLEYIKTNYEAAEDKLFWTEIYEEIQSVEGYQAMLDTIESQAKNLSAVSIFQEGDKNHFSSRNIERTADDFQKMRNIPISYEPSRGFETATGFYVTDLLLLGALFVIGSLLIFDEKKKEMFAVIRVTPGGRQRAVGAKIAAMGISAFAVEAILFMVNVLYCEAAFGLGSLGRSLQSNESFSGSILPLSVGAYLGMFLLLKWAGAFLAGLVILCIALLLGHPIFALLGISGVYGLGFLLYALIPPSSPVNLIRYTNPAIMLRTNTLFEQYLNFNLFGYPVNLIPVIWIYFISVISLLLGTVLLIFYKKKNYRMAVMPAIVTRFKITLPIAHSLFSHEAYKLLIRNRALLFLLLYGIVMWAGMTAKPLYRSGSELFYSSYMEMLSGDMSREKQAYLDEQQKQFDDAERQINKIYEMKEKGEITILEANELTSPYFTVLRNQAVFKEVQKRARYVKYQEGAKFIYDTGYRRLLLIKADEAQALVFLLVFVLCFTSVFGAEYKNHAIKIIKTTPLGRERTAQTKLELTVWVSLALCLMYQLPQLVLIGKSYGFPDLFYPAKSILEYRFLPVWIPIILVIIFHYEVQMIVMAGLAVILCAISLKLENAVFALLAGTMIFGAPILLSAMGLDFARNISILPFLEAGRHTPDTGSPDMWLLLLIFMVIAAACYSYIIHNFGSTGKKKKLLDKMVYKL